MVYCFRCGEEIERKEITVEPLGHNPGEPEIENEIELTCTQNGSHDEVIYCIVCHEELGRETKIEKALGHKASVAVKENEKKATCTEKGSYDEVVYCSVCHKEISRKSKTEKALGHFMSASVKENEKDATCTKNGSYDEVVYCSVCNKVVSRKTKTVKALGHTTTSGKCTRCGETITEVTKSSGGSDYESKNSSVLVWIPTHGGKKYHKNSSCSNMKDPEQVTLERAIELGFDACKKCY